MFFEVIFRRPARRIDVIETVDKRRLSVTRTDNYRLHTRSMKPAVHQLMNVISTDYNIGQVLQFWDLLIEN